MKSEVGNDFLLMRLIFHRLVMKSNLTLLSLVDVSYDIIKKTNT